MKPLVVLAAALLLVTPCAAQGPRHGVDLEAIREPVTMVVTGGMAAPGLLGRQRTWWFALGGAALGAVTCTAISNLVNEGGFSTCTTSGYVAFVAGGAAVGVAVAALTDKHGGGAP